MSNDKPREYCGLCGVTGSDNTIEQVYLGLHSQQHRGQEAAGFMMVVDGTCMLHKNSGLVDEVFAKIPDSWKKGKITRGISHVRYSTAGGSSVINAHPLMVNMGGQVVGIAHNGTISNAAVLRRELMEQGVTFQTSTDTEIILHLMARCLHRHQGKLWDALEEALARVEGAYCLLLLTKDELVAVRDPHGFRPLAIADFNEGGYMVASETIAFEVTGARYLRDINPGEILIIGKEGQTTSRRISTTATHLSQCIFEHVYFARPGSRVFGDSVYEVRKAMGRRLAVESPVNADIIVPVPDSGLYAALGFAEQSGIPFDLGLSRNHYVGRSFIDPGLTSRRKLVSRKLQPIVEAIRGKSVCLVDDSIVRGSTSRARIHSLREAGAKEVHMRISCPPHRFGCYFGIDFPERGALLANNVPLKDIAAHLRLDSLAYLSQEGMLGCVKAHPATDYCCACFDGNYPVPIGVK
jgi:amidophosphoribosyltransferase